MIGSFFNEVVVIISDTEKHDQPYAGESADGVISNARSHCHNLRSSSFLTANRKRNDITFFRPVNSLLRSLSLTRNVRDSCEYAAEKNGETENIILIPARDSDYL